MVARSRLPKPTFHFIRWAGEDDDPQECECGGQMVVYEMRREGQVPKKLLCCSRPKCNNSAEVTARIHRGEIVTNASP